MPAEELYELNRCLTVKKELRVKKERELHVKTGERDRGTGPGNGTGEGAPTATHEELRVVWHSYHLATPPLHHNA